MKAWYRWMGRRYTSNAAAGFLSNPSGAMGSIEDKSSQESFSMHVS